MMEDHKFSVLIAKTTDHSYSTLAVLVNRIALKTSSKFLLYVGVSIMYFLLAD